jgi:predicted negative regulator of RcsB-dependent stress response
MRTEQEISTLLARHEQDMADALQREEYYSQGPTADREKASDAAFEHGELEAAAQMLRWVLGLETDADYKHMFPEPS